MLQVKDFIFPAPAQNADDVQGEIVISYSKLAEHLNEAEGRFHGTISSQRNPKLLRPGAIKRRREQTRPEELELEDEQLYQQEESNDEKRAEAKDADWEP